MFKSYERFNYPVFVFLVVFLTSFICSQVILEVPRDMKLHAGLKGDGTYDISALKEPKGCPCENYGEALPGCLPDIRRESYILGIHVLLKKNLDMIWDGNAVCVPSVRILTNSYGFRDRNYSLVKPEDTFRIISLGDSFTFGTGVSRGNTYSGILERKLNNTSEENVQVLNFGIPSFSLKEKVKLLKARGIQFQPDLVILQYAGNDLINETGRLRLKKSIKRDLENDISSKKTKTSEVSNLDIKASQEAVKIYHNKIKENPDLFLERAKSYLGELQELSEREGFEVMIISVEGMNKFGIDHKEFIDKISSEFGFNYLSIHKEIDIWKKKYGKDRVLLMPPFDNHFSELGNELIAEKVFENISIQNISKEF